MTDTKDTNPKEAVGSQKLDMGLVPDTLEVCAAEGFLEGALKYGRFNWRIAGVRASTYYAALKRHQKKWWNGQDRDPVTRVHHLNSAIACLTILRDAELYGKLNDDRPPCPNPDVIADAIDAADAQVAHLKKLFEQRNPKQYTIDDTPRSNKAELALEIEPPPLTLEQWPPTVYYSKRYQGEGLTPYEVGSWRCACKRHPLSDDYPEHVDDANVSHAKDMCTPGGTRCPKCRRMRSLQVLKFPEAFCARCNVAFKIEKPT
jgi:hypothetical protein